MVGKGVGLGFEIISKLDSYFLMTVSMSFRETSQNFTIYSRFSLPLLLIFRSYKRSKGRMWPCSGSKWCHLYWYYRFWVQKRPCPSRSSCLWSQKVLRRGNWIWGNDAQVVQNLRNALWQNVDRWWILASLLFQGREVQILFPLWGVRQNLDSWSHFCELSWIMNKVSYYEWFKIQRLITFS